MANGWKEKKRQQLVEKGTNPKTTWGSIEYPGLNPAVGPDNLVIEAREFIRKSLKEARAKRTFPGDNGAMEEQYRNTHR